jgi:hypothetical protein
MPMPEEMIEQLPLIDKVVDAYHFPRLRVPGIEADDVIGTLTELAVAAGHDVVIVSSDKDFAQLVTDKVVMHDTIRDVVYDAELVKKKWGVKPAQIVDYLALVGDPRRRRHRQQRRSAAPRGARLAREPPREMRGRGGAQAAHQDPPRDRQAVGAVVAGAGDHRP